LYGGGFSRICHTHLYLLLVSPPKGFCGDFGRQSSFTSRLSLAHRVRILLGIHRLYLAGQLPDLCITFLGTRLLFQPFPGRCKFFVCRGLGDGLNRRGFGYWSDLGDFGFWATNCPYRTSSQCPKRSVTRRTASYALECGYIEPFFLKGKIL